MYIVNVYNLLTAVSICVLQALQGGHCGTQNLWVSPHQRNYLRRCNYC